MASEEKKMEEGENEAGDKVDAMEESGKKAKRRRRHRHRHGHLRRLLLDKLEQVLSPECRTERVRELMRQSSDGWLSLGDLHRHCGPLLLDATGSALLEKSEPAGLSEIGAGSELVESRGWQVRPSPTAPPPEARTVFVDGLKPTAGADWLQAQMSAVGLITRVHVPQPRIAAAKAKSTNSAKGGQGNTRRPRSVVSRNRGFAFVTFATTKAAAHALKLSSIKNQEKNDKSPAEEEKQAQPEAEDNNESASQSNPSPRRNQEAIGEKICGPEGEEVEYPSAKRPRLQPPQPNEDKEPLNPSSSQPHRKRRKRSKRKIKSEEKPRPADLRHKRETQSLRILPHAEWARLKAAYKAEQKAAAAALKASLPPGFAVPRGTLSKPRLRGRDRLLLRAEVFRGGERRGDKKIETGAQSSEQPPQTVTQPPPNPQSSPSSQPQTQTAL